MSWIVQKRYVLISQQYAQKRQIEIITLSAKLEMELARLDAEEAELFRTEMGLNESALARVIDVFLPHPRTDNLFHRRFG